MPKYQINGESTTVKKALHQVAFRLHDNPSRSQQSILSSPSIYRSGIAFNNPHVGGGPPMGGTSLMGQYGTYKNDGRDWSSATTEFALRLVCPTENLGAVIGKGGAVIKQIRQESGAFIVVDSAGADANDCIISVSAKEVSITVLDSTHIVTIITKPVSYSSRCLKLLLGLLML